MLCLDPNQPQPNFTEKASKLIPTLKAIMFLQIIFGICYIFIDPFHGFFIIIAATFIWCGIRSANFCMMMIYNILCLYGLFQMIIYIGGYYSSDDYKNDKDFKKILTYISFASVPFYIIAIYYSFMAYKEFKAMMYGQAQGGALSSFGFAQSQQVNYSSQQQQDSESQQQYQQQNYQQQQQQPFPAPGQPQQQNKGYVPFSGQGYRLG